MKQYRRRDAKRRMVELGSVAAGEMVENINYGEKDRMWMEEMSKTGN